MCKVIATRGMTCKSDFSVDSYEITSLMCAQYPRFKLLHLHLRLPTKLRNHQLCIQQTAME